MKPDWYESFAGLSSNEVEGVDFRICVLDRPSDILIMAPHGGSIESGTSEIARAIARSDYALYLFEGLRPDRAHCELHITSHKFNEPKALEIARKSSTLIAVHGRANKGDEVTTWLGGLDADLVAKIERALCENGFRAQQVKDVLAGMCPRNICNRSGSDRGVQLEIPRALRDRLIGDTEQLKAFAEAIRQANHN